MVYRKILVRFDDICPTMNFYQFNIAVEMMDEYGVKPLIGVIPDCKDPDLQIEKYNSDFWDYVKRLKDKGYAIAMHGVNHVFRSQHKGVINNRIGSEFSGLSLEEQTELIRKGKSILESHGIHTDVFFAPAHSYDWNTLKALTACGFNYMSDGKSSKPYLLDGITCIPCRSNGCPSIGKKGFYTAVFHAHEWAFKEKEYDYRAFCNLLDKYHSDIVPFDEYVQCPFGNRTIQRIDEEIYLKWQYGVKPILSKLYHSTRG